MNKKFHGKAFRGLLVFLLVLTLNACGTKAEKGLPSEQPTTTMEITAFPSPTASNGDLFQASVDLSLATDSSDPTVLQLTPNQVVTVNNIEMRLEKLEVTPTSTTAILCYQKPSPASWSIRPILRAGGLELANYSYSLVFDLDFGGYHMVESALPKTSLDLQLGRCVQVDFLFGPSSKFETISLTIPNLEQDVPEVIPDEEITAARAKLLPQGIDMGWDPSPIGGGPTYNKLPEGMTKQEAYQLFIEALGYVYEGPWEFTVEVNP